jgi:hypothetical protein
MSLLRIQVTTRRGVLNSWETDISWVKPNRASHLRLILTWNLPQIQDLGRLLSKMAEFE